MFAQDLYYTICKKQSTSGFHFTGSRQFVCVDKKNFSRVFPYHFFILLYGYSEIFTTGLQHFYYMFTTSLQQALNPHGWLTCGIFSAMLFKSLQRFQLKKNYTKGI